MAPHFKSQHLSWAPPQEPPPQSAEYLQNRSVSKNYIFVTKTRNQMEQK